MAASVIEKDRENASDFRTATLGHWQAVQPGLHVGGSYFRKTHTAPIRDDPSIQIRSVRFLCGMTAPAILLMEFALNKVITHLCNSHRQVGSLESIRVDFAQQPHNSFAAESASGYWQAVPINLLR